MAAASLYSSHGTDEVTPEPEPQTAVAPVATSAPETKAPETMAPELVESCEDAPDEKRCEKEEAKYERCATSGFAGSRCLDSKALDRDQQAFVTDCRRADVTQPLPTPCAKLAKPVANAYRYCRFLGRSTLRCDRSARYAACIYRGGGRICTDAAPVYRACQTRSVNGAKIPRRFCLEGDVQYERCRHAYTVGSRSDMCRPATAVYIDCRPGAGVHVCEKAQDDYARRAIAGPPPAPAP
ncbi:hypothetical protein [Nonomuraea jabiensis]|uniref:hypothetical protein n=1 Tax=Nonomuraea jabiensis TaxID=882448 RepID=UPI0036AA42B9